MTLRDDLEKIRQEREKNIKDVGDLKKLDALRVELLGKKGPITQALRGMRNLSADERPKFGQFANSVRDELQSAIETQRDELKKALLNKQLQNETIDVTLPGKPVAQGQPHVIQQIIDQLKTSLSGWAIKFYLVPKLKKINITLK